MYPPWKELLRHQTSSHRIIFSHKAHTNTSKQNIQWITMYSSQRRVEGTLSGNWFKFRHVSVVLLRDVLSQLSHIGHRLSDNKRRTVNHVEVASVYSLPSCEPLLQVCISVALRSWSSSSRHAIRLVSGLNRLFIWGSLRRALSVCCLCASSHIACICIIISCSSPSLIAFCTSNIIWISLICFLLECSVTVSTCNYSMNDSFVV
jgi:hypothetical protein